MSTKCIELSQLLTDAKRDFELTFKSSIEVAVCAPGRVNLIGEHTDYNDGFVFPMALSLCTVVVGKKSADPQKCKVKSLDMSTIGTSGYLAEFILPSESNKLEPSEPFWCNYVKGVVANFHAKVPGFEAVISSSVPIGSGLSSSAALEVAMYTFLEALTNSPAESPKSKALSCQKAEHEFVGVPCGIMDQFISTMGVKGSALLIDCRSLESFLVPLNDQEVTFLIVNSNVKHSLSGSEYSTRRNQCHEAARLMNKSSLRDASLQDLQNFRAQLDNEVFRRSRHVVSEIARTQQAKTAMEGGDYELFGRLMDQSHDSLSSDYDVSCSELDELVVIARSVDGVFGSRMTGAGFGGCTVTLVKHSSVERVIQEINNRYSGTATMYVCQPSDGARVLYKAV